MRYGLVVPGLLFAAACGQGPAPEPTAVQATPVSQGDLADTSCQVVLRHTYIDFESRMGPQADCSSGTCWVVITVTFDVATSQSLAQAEASVLYQGEGSSSWQQSPQALPVFGAPVGFRRYEVTLRAGTYTSGPGDTTVRLIPFIAGLGGGRLFDHNRVSDPLGSYVLDAQDNWTVGDDASACPGQTPSATLTATFATGWQNTSVGTLAGAGKLDVAYDVYRMPQTLSCTTDGVDAFATVGSVQFEPSGQVLTEVVAGPRDPSTGTVASIPLEFDVPPGTRSAALWFMTSSECNGGPYWDSDYGRNYVFTTP